MGVYIDRLLSLAEAHWLAWEPIPVDLYMSMVEVGIDVEQAETEFNQQQDK